MRSALQRLLADPRVRYLLVGGGTSALYLGLFTAGVLVAGQGAYFLVLLVAQVLTISVAFPLYRRFVFESDNPVRGDFVRFLGVWSTGAVVGALGLPVLVELVGLHPVLAQLLLVAGVAVGSFLAHKYLSFGERGR